jgi:hypothetical protein
MDLTAVCFRTRTPPTSPILIYTSLNDILEVFVCRLQLIIWLHLCLFTSHCMFFEDIGPEANTSVISVTPNYEWAVFIIYIDQSQHKKTIEYHHSSGHLLWTHFRASRSRRFLHLQAACFWVHLPLRIPRWTEPAIPHDGRVMEGECGQINKSESAYQWSRLIMVEGCAGWLEADYQPVIWLLLSFKRLMDLKAAVLEAVSTSLHMNHWS